MAGINYGRVLLGGLAAGVVANIGDSITGLLLVASDMQRMIQRLNLDPGAMNAPSTMATWIAIDFVYATLMVWTYAAIRPRLGPGPQTAVTAGLVIFAAVTIVLLGFVPMGVFTPDLFVKQTLCSLVNAVATSYVGGMVYKEA